MKSNNIHRKRPELNQLKAELKRENHKKRYNRVLLSTVCTLIVTAAIAVLVATLWMPVLQIYGTSMTPTLNDGEIVIALKGADLENGDLAAFYLGNKLLIKRCIAKAGQWVNIDSDGNIYIDGTLLDEPYLTEKSLGECNIALPCQVPEGCYFMAGDRRATSIDSRSTAVGFVSDEQIVGKITFRIWPLSDFGFVSR